MILDTLQQIKSGLWAIEPVYGLSLEETILNIFSKQPVNDAVKKTDITSKHYFIDDTGKKYTSSSLHEAPDGMVGIIHINGPMIKYGNYYCWGADELMQQAKIFDNAPNVIGQVWVTDTGGGAVNAIPLYIDFLAHKKKPVVDLCDMCASAGYYKAVPTDYIMANNNISAAFGSIGVMATIQDASEYFKNQGIKEHVIYADQSEGYKNETFKRVLEGDYTLMKDEVLNPLAIKFQNDVKKHRPKLNTKIEGILNGKMFYADEALKYGLIDGIGNLELAIEKVKVLAYMNK